MVNVVALLFAAASRSYMVSSRLLLGFVGGACSPESNGECGCVAVRGYKPLLHIHLAWLFRGYKPLLHGFFATAFGFCRRGLQPRMARVNVVAVLFAADNRKGRPRGIYLLKQIIHT